MNSKTSNPIIKSMRVIGDLDHEFYHDERQREVWNEASAVGLQSAIFITLFAAAVLPWVAGSPGAWMALGLLIALTVVSVIVTSYARARTVDAYTSTNWWRLRTVFILAPYIVSIAGIVVQLFIPGRTSNDLTSSFVGGVIGSVGMVVAVTVWIRRKRRKEAELEALDEI